jgi:hypothetical protein
MPAQAGIRHRADSGLDMALRQRGVTGTMAQIEGSMF